MSSLQSFIYFNNKKIIIPQIQRDYAEGRELDPIPEIRQSLLNEMISVVCGEKPDTELDFVYGYQRNNCFEPLDGQQRLTTLFLLQWFLVQNKSQMLVGGRARLSYQNRQSSTDFCEVLVKQSAKEIISSFANKQSNRPNLSLKQFIKECGWYRWNWNYDSTIQSMLVVIDNIYRILAPKINYDFSDTSALYSNFGNIKFRFLNLDDFLMGDELYIKMNARGKELSTFDLLKSFLEHDLSSQQLNPNIRTSWQTKIDCDWMDYLWWKYYNPTTAQNDDNVGLIEKKYETILYILVWYQIVFNLNRYGLERKDKKEFANQRIDNIIKAYKQLNGCQLNYELLMKQFDALFLRNGNTWVDLDNITGIFGHSLLNDCIEVKNYDDLIFLFAYLEWIINVESLSNIQNDSDKHNDFKSFMRFIKNVYTLENGDNQRIDSVDDFANAMKYVDKLTKGYHSNQQVDTFNKYVRDILTFEPGCQIYSGSIDEEKEKASLILNDNNWANAIQTIEDNDYLKGQINALLFVENSDIQRFQDLVTKFNYIFDGVNDTSNGIKLLQLLMVFDQYNLCADGSKNGTLMEINQHRDYSLKHHFRDNQCCILRLFKEVMDQWINNYDGDGFNQFYNNFLNAKQVDIRALPYWRQFIIYNQKWYESISEVSKHLFTEEDNGALYITKTMSREELVICYIHGVVKKTDGAAFLDDQSGENAISFLPNGASEEYRVECSSANQYSLKIGGVDVLINVDYVALLNELNNRIGPQVF